MPHTVNHSVLSTSSHPGDSAHSVSLLPSLLISLFFLLLPSNAKFCNHFSNSELSCHHLRFFPLLFLGDLIQTHYFKYYLYAPDSHLFFYNPHPFLNSNITYLTVYLTLSLGYPILHTIASLKLKSWLPPAPSLIICLSYPSKSLLLLHIFLGQNPISIFLPHASYISKFSQICFHNTWWKNLTSSYNLLSTPDPNTYQLSPGLLQLFPVSACISQTTTCYSLPPMQQVIRMIILRHAIYHSSHQQHFPSPLKSIINY